MYTTLKVVYTLSIFGNLPMFTGVSLLGGDYGIDRVVELMQAADRTKFGGLVLGCFEAGSCKEILIL